MGGDKTSAALDGCLIVGALYRRVHFHGQQPKQQTCASFSIDHGATGVQGVPPHPGVHHGSFGGCYSCSGLGVGHAHRMQRANQGRLGLSMNMWKPGSRWRRSLGRRTATTPSMSAWLSLLLLYALSRATTLSYASGSSPARSWPRYSFGPAFSLAAAASVLHHHGSRSYQVRHPEGRPAPCLTDSPV